MKRSGFKRKGLPPPGPAKQMDDYTPKPRAVAVAVAGPARASVPVPKAVIVQSEEYRRLVASLPCVHCGFHGRSQAAHPNTGKGMGMKTDDRDCFPLCAPRPGDSGCHYLFDQGAMFTKADRRVVEKRWTTQTQREIQRRGLWPPGLAVP